VICEIVNDDGTMARVPDLVRFCKKHGVVMITVAALGRYRLEADFESSLAAIDGLPCVPTTLSTCGIPTRGAKSRSGPHGRGLSQHDLRRNR
jgi:hypothetical protein